MAARLIGGLRSSRFALGCMSIGDPSHTGVGRHAWTIGDEDRALQLVRAAWESGINHFDTANVYASGDSERMTGRCLRRLGLRRSQYLVATKLGLPMKGGPNEVGTSRKHIREAVDESLERLGLDYVDLLIIHRLDPRTSAEETMQALDDVVRSGRALYLGASSMLAWEFAKLQHTAEKHGWTKFVCMQNHYNLIYREEEREMLPLLADQGVACTPWSPLARGLLARSSTAAASTNRSRTDPLLGSGGALYNPQDAGTRGVLEAVGRVADEHCSSRAAVALAWLLRKGCVPVVGASSLPQLKDSLEAEELSGRLTQRDMEMLEEPYCPLPHAVGIGRSPDDGWGTIKE